MLLSRCVVGGCGDQAPPWPPRARRLAQVGGQQKAGAVARCAEPGAVAEDAKRRRMLRGTLAERLESLEDGRVAFPARRYPLATVWWEAGALQG